MSQKQFGLHDRWRIRALAWLMIAYLFIVLGSFSTVGAYPLFEPLLAAPVMQNRSAPLTLAFYYTWFDENSWTYDKLSDLPTTLYASRDRAVMGQHIEAAQRAGIDALVVAWYGPSGEFNQTEPNLAALLEEAAARNFKIAILFETDSPFLDSAGAVTSALHHALSIHTPHPAYLRVNDAPVLFFWHPHLYDVNTWQGIRQQVDPGHHMLWINEGVDTRYLAIFDGHYLYSNTWNPPADLTYTNQKFARLVAEAGQNYGAYKYWAATVMPGYNDTRIRPGNGFAHDRAGGNYYAQSWQAAIASQPDWVVITSFNEWPEGTYIEPSLAFGDLYLNLTAQWSQTFRAGNGASRSGSVAPAAPAAAAVPLPTSIPPTPIPTPTVPTAFVEVALLNLRSGPSIDFAILAQMPANSALAIRGRHPAWPDWWQVAHQNSIGWVYAPLVRAAGPLELTAVLDDDDLPARLQHEVWASPSPLGYPHKVSSRPVLSN